MITSPCPDCRGDGRVAETRTFTRRRPRRRRPRLDPAPVGPGTGRTPRRARRRPLRAPGGAARRRLRPGRRRPPRRAARVDRPGRPRRHPGVRDARRHRERSPCPPGTQTGHVIKLRGPRRPPRAGARARRPRRPGRGGHADAISPRHRRTFSASSRPRAGKTSAPPTRASWRACAPPSADRARIGARQGRRPTPGVRPGPGNSRHGRCRRPGLRGRPRRAPRGARRRTPSRPGAAAAPR